MEITRKSIKKDRAYLKTTSNRGMVKSQKQPPFGVIEQNLIRVVSPGSDTGSLGTLRFHICNNG